MREPFDIPEAIQRMEREKRIAESMARQWTSEAERLEINIEALRAIQEGGGQ